MGRKRRSPEEKARIALEASRDDKPVREIAQKYGVHPNQISQWKRQLQDHAADAFRNGENRREAQLEQERDELHRQLGQEHAEKSWLEKKLRELGLSE